MFGEVPVPVPIRPPQIPRGLDLDRTRASAVRDWRLIPLVMARRSDLLREPVVLQNGAWCTATVELLCGAE